MDYAVHILTMIAITGIAAVSLNLLIGETGLVSVAQAAFAGIGAYGMTLLMLHAGIPFLAAALFSALIAGAIALIIGAIFLSLREVYYVFGTVGLNMIVWAILLNWDSLTRGPLGIPGITRPEVLGISFADNTAFLILCAVVLLAVFAAHYAIMKSNFGRVLHAVREDEEAIAVLGYKTEVYKIVIFVISAALVAFSGSLYATYLSYINPSAFTVNDSIFILAIVILGGLGSAYGAIVGTCMLVGAFEALRFIGFPASIAGDMRQVFYGLILILFMLYLPRGLFGKFRI
ncbi:branched-chain amino acid ABC transporter permease [Candidatus Kaiserbacteria bacterium]|nr:branched-chain amino acid ABC transporter permease [Candidatus Kaiserbacteria bacterium]